MSSRTSDATAPEAEATLEQAAPAKPRTTRSRSRKTVRKPPQVMLPVLVVAETILLPHMSIPFPIEDEESARVVERATRGESRHVLVLTERPVPPEAGAVDEDGELRALLADAIIEAAAHSNLDDEPQWIPDPEPAPQEYELTAA